MGIVTDLLLHPMPVVVFGVSGSGKSTVGEALAQRLAYEFCDADDLHSRANIEKMHAGHPLTDEDRWPWLDAVGQRMTDVLAQERGVVMACSALKRSYRDLLRDHVASTFFVFLDGSEQLIASRVNARKGSFMPASLLSSQFEALEPLGADEIGVRIDVAQDLAHIVEEAATALFPDAGL